MISRRLFVNSLCLMLLSSPAVAEDVLRSTKHPITVHYTGAAQLSFAQQVLVAADEAWGFHVDGLKLPAPPPELRAPRRGLLRRGRPGAGAAVVRRLLARPPLNRIAPAPRPAACRPARRLETYPPPRQLTL
jgi:hypothetical protein